MVRSFIVVALMTLASLPAQAKITVAPFASVSSTKQIKPDKANNKKENATLKQRTTYGLRAGISFWRILSVQAQVGTGKLTTTEKTQDAVDQYDDIDYEKDLEMDTSDPEAEVKTTDTQNMARLGIAFDPGFWIFILRAQAGAQATQRTVEMEQADGEMSKTEEPIKYKPYAGAGAGVRLGPRMFFIAEYNIFMYKFPETAPFEREVTVSFGASI